MTDIRAIQITKIIEEINGTQRLQCRILQYNRFWDIFTNQIWLTKEEWNTIGKEMGWTK